MGTSGHGHDGAAEQGHNHVEEPPAEATVSVADITDRLNPAGWRIDSAEESSRSIIGAGGLPAFVHDVVVLATRSV